jgi:hypothetical protein
VADPGAIADITPSRRPVLQRGHEVLPPHSHAAQATDEEITLDRAGFFWSEKILSFRRPSALKLPRECNFARPDPETLLTSAIGKQVRTPTILHRQCLGGIAMTFLPRPTSTPCAGAPWAFADVNLRYPSTCVFRFARLRLWRAKRCRASVRGRARRCSGSGGVVACCRNRLLSRVRLHGEQPAPER